MGILFTFEFIVRALLCVQKYGKKLCCQRCLTREAMRRQIYSEVPHIHAIHFLYSIQFCIPYCHVKISPDFYCIRAETNACDNPTEYKTLKIDPFSGNKKH